MNKDILNYKQSLGFPNNYENMVHSQRGLWKTIFFSLLFSLLAGFFQVTTGNHVLSFETNGILELWPDNAQPSGFSHQFIPLTTLKQISIRQLRILSSHISIVTLVKKILKLCDISFGRPLGITLLLIITWTT